MEINFNETKENWDAFVAKSPQRSVFVTSDFLDSLDVKFDLVTAYENNNIEAGTIVIYSETGTPITSAYPFTQYQGIILADNDSMQLYSKIGHQYKILEQFVSLLVERYKQLFVGLSWRFEDLRAFQWFNYHEPQKGMFNIDLRYNSILHLGKYGSFEDYLGTIRTVRKQEFNKAKNTLKLVESTDDVVLDELHEMTFERQGLERDPGQSNLVRSITRNALMKGYGSLKLALLDDNPISAMFFLYDDRASYYLFGATDPGHRKSFAGTFLLLNMIKESMTKGVKEVDFVGVNSPNRGDFKLSFNGELVRYFDVSIET